MKILLDENLPAKLRYDFGESHEIHTVKEMGWLGKKNGELLGLAVFNGFEIFITLDKHLKQQQNISKFDIRLIILLAVDNRHQTLQPLIEKINPLLKKTTLPKVSEISPE